MKIGTAGANPGNKGTGFLKIGELADGSSVNVPVMILRGAKPGPCLWVQAMIHGDEIHGCLSVLRVVSILNLDKMNGTLVVIPTLNVLGARWYHRTVMDPSNYFHNVDLNLAFPGEQNGDFMEQAANILLRQIRTKADYMIDLHSSGMLGMIWPGWSLCYNDGTKTSQKALDLAKSFGFENIVASDFEKAEGPGYVLAHALRMPFAVVTGLGIPSIIVEAGGGVEIKEEIVRRVTDGILNVLKYLKMIEGQFEWKDHYTIFKRIVDVKANYGGVFTTEKKCGEPVYKDERLGTMMSLFGERIEEIVSPIDGVVLTHKLYPLVSTGTLLFHLGMRA